MNEYDIAVIGGGPIGMFATFYAGLRNANVVLIESTAELGGQPGALYPQKKLFDVPGFPELTGAELVAQLRAQMTRFDPDVMLNSRVTAIDATDSGVTLTTTSGTVQAKAVVLATGAGAFAPRQLAVDYDHALDGHQIIYTISDLDALAGQRVAIAGGGDSAIDWALTLEPVAEQVDIIHRRKQFRGLESSVTSLEQSSITLRTPQLIEGVVAGADDLDITLHEVKGEAITHVHADKLLVSYGFASDNKQLREWQLDLDHNHVSVSQEFTTNLPRVYAIGDAATYPGKLDLIAAGFGEAPRAIDGIMQQLFPERRQPLHSSSLGLETKRER